MTKKANAGGNGGQTKAKRENVHEAAQSAEGRDDIVKTEQNSNARDVQTPPGFKNVRKFLNGCLRAY